MNKNFALLLAFTCLYISGISQAAKPLSPVPSSMQLEWSDLEFYLFVHFGPNTFTNLEWGEGTEHEEVFNPTALSCEQWCKIAKAAGAKGIIITAKHHDGFCLWPSKYSTHTVAQSKWREGKGDVLRELSEACKTSGLKLGIYLSPWDRNHPKYGTEEYNTVFVDMMKEVVSNYGPLFEFWWDGANGEGPNGKKQVYDWHRFEQTIRTIAPNTPVFSDIGPDIRWVGNEKGIAGKTNWNLLDTAGFTRGEGAPPTDTLNMGNVYGKNWIPAECDVSIRPGWFYHSEEDEKVKTPEQLFDLYLKSVGRGANLLLNVPPDRRGLFNEHDSAALMGFKKLRDESFEHNLSEGLKLTSKDGVHQIAFDEAKNINCVVLKENLSSGQQCQKFRLLLMNNKKEIVKQLDGTTIGRKRILTFPAVDVSQIHIIIDEQKAPVKISDVEAYKIPQNLVEKD
jgi:alpha-L-fucosidase